MSAAATAAGYLYASGRLRGKANKEEGQPKDESGSQRRRIQVRALPDAQPEPAQRAEAPARPKRTPTIQYRTKKWRPDAP